MTFDPIHNVIPLPESEDGHLLSGSPLGATIDLFGQEVVPTSTSVPQENKKGKADKRHLWPI
jgi:hypothetical protein